MIISRTPLRVSFVGGGSDLPAFYREYGGAVVSTAIDKFIYITLNRKFDSAIRVAYSKNEEVGSVEQIEHPLVRAAMKFVGLSGGVEITTIADVPSHGTGLGSSSSFTVGLLHVLNAYLGRYVSADKLGMDSCTVEIDICGEPIGKQDQYAAAFGGFNYIAFHPNGSVVVSPVICRKETLDAVAQSCLFFYTGVTRSASAILRSQNAEVRTDRQKQRTLQRMVHLAAMLRDELNRNNVDAFGEILHENWELKKSLTDGITTREIDAWYDAARRAGATGGKVLGAGTGGFLLLFAPPEKHERLKQALPNLRAVDMAFEPTGSQIIFYR
ncbi:MAG TPA: kinase [Stellaceae bacterium]|nr:kinase [Stellaceae bacterium]